MILEAGNTTRSVVLHPVLVFHDDFLAESCITKGVLSFWVSLCMYFSDEEYSSFKRFWCNFLVQCNNQVCHYLCWCSALAHIWLLCPPDVPLSVFEQLLSDTHSTVCVCLVLIFFSTPVSSVYFQVCLFVYIGAFSFSACLIPLHFPLTVNIIQDPYLCFQFSSVTQSCLTLS